MPELERVFDELIKLFEVDIRKELGSKIADGDPLPAEEIRVLGNETSDDFTEQSDGLLILHAPLDDTEERIVIHGSKELVDIAFEDKAGTRSVPAHTSQHPIERVYCFVRSLAFLAGERMGNECWFKNGVEYGENRMVQNAISHAGLVNAALLGIADGKCAVRFVSVGPGCKFTMQGKKILFQPALEFLHILPSLFALPKLFPCNEKSFLGGNVAEKVPVCLHCCIIAVLAASLGIDRTFL